ncbi:hypothetical protein ACP70R_049649 [Stipagrostis hirtigluma subsp. patula]
MATQLLLLWLWLSCAAVRSARGEGQLLTDGFAAVELTEAQFKVQKPYDVPLADRYESRRRRPPDVGLRHRQAHQLRPPRRPPLRDQDRGKLFLTKSSHTIDCLIYSSGVWQFEGYGYVPAGTSGASVMQVFGAAEHATTLMLHVYDGRLTYYHDDARVVDGDVYDRWFRLNVIHDVAASNVTVFVDGEHRLTAPGRGGDAHYFKFGVYGQSKNNPSYRMESRWRDVKVFTKC